MDDADDDDVDDADDDDVVVMSQLYDDTEAPNGKNPHGSEVERIHNRAKPSLRRIFHA